MAIPKAKTRLWGVNLEVRERKESVGAIVTIYMFKCPICGKLMFGLTENGLGMNAYNHLTTHLTTHPKALEKIVLEYKQVEI